ncbi:lipopolysaccharide export system protein LptA [Sphingomonas gellani]|uniref:Lipopolysaccharide export system protein LptA n=1 Tax=Sphingomonas gellani TaxID=1166340 RepID=A0A1H8AQD4_9SPHN|nr:LptA/OstA family protein [Sphingomonas gellani]SEM72028.1 lipopolysaccharide export system protein LptA [Sphingomonas gellani]
MRSLPLIVLIAALASAADGQSRHNSDAPINLSADHVELQDKANRAIFTGGVSVRQAEMTLDAARMTVTYTGQIADGSPQISRLDASGNVVVTRPDQTARGQYGIYDLNRRVITMLGGVRLTQQGNTVNGSRLTINLDTGRAVIDGSSVAGGGSAGGGATSTAPGGRVTGTFSVPKRN